MAIKDGIDEDLAVQTIVGCWEDWTSARRSKEGVWQECVNNYLVEVDETKYADWPWRCKVADTFSQETADTIASSLRNALFPTNEDFYEIVGHDAMGKQFAPVMKEYLDTYLMKMKWIERLMPFFKQLAVIGNAPVLLPWECTYVQRKKRIREINTVTNEPKVRVETLRSKKYDGPGLQVLDAFDVAFDPLRMDLSKAPMARRVVLPRDLAMKEYPDVDWDDLDRHAGKPHEDSDTHKAGRALVFGLDDHSVPDAEQAENDEVEVLEWYGDLVLDGERHPELIGAVLNRRALAKFETETYWGGRPIFWETYDNVWWTAYGKGPLEPVRGTQALIDTFTNQKADIINLIINPTFKYMEDGVVDPENLLTAPGFGILVNTMDNVQPVSLNSNVGLAFNEIADLRGRGERSTGASSMDKGQMMTGRRTAYEASQVAQGAGGRRVDVTKHLANNSMEYMLEFYVACIQQFKWGSKEIPEEVLLGDYGVKFLGAETTAMRQYAIQNITSFVQTVLQSQIMVQGLKVPGTLRKLSELYGIKKSDEMVKTDEEYAAEQEQQRQMEMAQQQQAQPGNPPGTMGSQGMPQPVDQEMAAFLGGGMG